jgi:hypothetical protein
MKASLIEHVLAFSGRLSLSGIQRGATSAVRGTMSQPKANLFHQDALPSIESHSDDFLDETIKVWQPRSPHRKLTREDAREILSNMCGFFQVLREWDDERRKTKN